MRSLRRLREQIVRANLLVQEACFIADELERHTEYKLTLQIPADNLNANRKVCALVPNYAKADCCVVTTCCILNTVFIDRGMLFSVNQLFRFDVGLGGSKSGVWKKWRTVLWT